jgi:hypothetical protein
MSAQDELSAKTVAVTSVILLSDASESITIKYNLTNLRGPDFTAN